MVKVVVNEQHVLEFEGIGFKLKEKGVFSDEVVERIKASVEDNQYIETQEKYYDDEDCPTFCNWIDVEGFGYGWLHLVDEWKNPDSWKEMMSLKVDRLIETLIERRQSKGYENVLYFIYGNDDTITYHIIDLNGWRLDYAITVSKEELTFL